MIKFLIVLSSMIGLVGCTTTPINFNVQGPIAKKRIPVELKNVNVQANLPEVTAPFQATLSLALKNSLDKSIEEGKFFQDDSKSKVDLSANIESVDYRMIGCDGGFTVNYILKRRDDSKILLETKITTSGHDCTFYGDDRINRIFNAAGKENTHKFLDVLNSYSIEKITQP